jgi:hypothetical protein
MTNQEYITLGVACLISSIIGYLIYKTYNENKNRDK